MDSKQGFNRMFAAIMVVAFVWVAVLIWAVISLVNFVTG